MTLREEVKSHVQYAEDRGDVSLNFVHDQLDNIAKLISNQEFINEFKEAMNDIVDQNNNGKLDSEDIKLLADVFTVSINLNSGFRIAVAFAAPSPK